MPIVRAEWPGNSDTVEADTRFSCLLSKMILKCPLEYYLLLRYEPVVLAQILALVPMLPVARLLVVARSDVAGAVAGHTLSVLCPSSLHQIPRACGSGCLYTSNWEESSTSDRAHRTAHTGPTPSTRSVTTSPCSLFAADMHLASIEPSSRSEQSLWL